MMIPANWQAQCRLAASQRLCQRGDQMVADLESDGIEAGHQRRNAPIPLCVAQPHVAIDNGERAGIAGNAAEKAQAQI